MKFWRVQTRVLLIIVAAMPGIAAGQIENPFERDSGAITAGAALYGNRCADCHGADALGNNGPPLTGLWAAGARDSDLFATVRAGVEGSAMPPSTAADDDLWAILAYLKSISVVAPFTIAAGNAQRGREKFESLCIECHRVDGRGGSLGPDLSAIAATRSAEALISAIRDPGKLVPRGYRPVTVVTRNGEQILGARKAEDAFTLQMIDTDERLRGYRKSDLVRITEEEGSLMPSFGLDELDAQSLDDVLAYLSTLRADR